MSSTRLEVCSFFLESPLFDRSLIRERHLLSLPKMRMRMRNVERRMEGERRGLDDLRASGGGGVEVGVKRIGRRGSRML